jgi:cytochrome bd-type quinol oxidase subunit 1
VSTGHIPHLRIVVAVSAFVLCGFGLVSGYVLGWTADDVTKGNVIGTWINFAMLAVGFWLGSSSGGKAKDEQPHKVQIEQPPENPTVQVETQP